MTSAPVHSFGGTSVSSVTGGRLSTSFAVTLKGDGRFIGRCGFTHNAWVEGWEINIVLASNYWKQGYGMEVGSALIRHGFERFRYEIIFGVMDSGNIGSIKLCEALQMKFAKQITTNGQKQFVYVLENRRTQSVGRSE